MDDMIFTNHGIECVRCSIDFAWRSIRFCADRRLFVHYSIKCVRHNFVRFGIPYTSGGGGGEVIFVSSLSLPFYQQYFWYSGLQLEGCVETVLLQCVLEVKGVGYC